MAYILESVNFLASISDHSVTKGDVSIRFSIADHSRKTRGCIVSGRKGLRRGDGHAARSGGFSLHKIGTAKEENGNVVVDKLPSCTVRSYNDIIG